MFCFVLKKRLHQGDRYLNKLQQSVTEICLSYGGHRIWSEGGRQGRLQRWGDISTKSKGEQSSPGRQSKEVPPPQRQKVKGREEYGVCRAVQVLLMKWRPWGRKAQKMRQSWEQGLKRCAVFKTWRSHSDLEEEANLFYHVAPSSQNMQLTQGSIHGLGPFPIISSFKMNSL